MHVLCIFLLPICMSALFLKLYDIREVSFYCVFLLKFIVLYLFHYVFIHIHILCTSYLNRKDTRCVLYKLWHLQMLVFSYLHWKKLGCTKYIFYIFKANFIKINTHWSYRTSRFSEQRAAKNTASLVFKQLDLKLRKITGIALVHL